MDRGTPGHERFIFRPDVRSGGESGAAEDPAEFSFLFQFDQCPADRRLRGIQFLGKPDRLDDLIALKRIQNHLFLVSYGHWRSSVYDPVQYHNTE